MTRPDGSQEVIVASGWYDIDSKTEILDLETKQWRSGPVYPVPGRISGASTIPYKDSFIAIGGHIVYVGYTDRIYYFDRESDAWAPMSASLAEERYFFPTLYIPDDAC